MSSSSQPSSSEAVRHTNKSQLFNDQESTETYVHYSTCGNMFLGWFENFNDFSSYGLQDLVFENDIFGLTDLSHNDFDCYLNLLKMFYAKLKRKILSRRRRSNLEQHQRYYYCFELRNSWL